jgi:hypothetical protein
MCRWQSFRKQWRAGHLRIEFGLANRPKVVLMERPPVVGNVTKMVVRNGTIGGR